MLFPGQTDGQMNKNKKKKECYHPQKRSVRMSCYIPVFSMSPDKLSDDNNKIIQVIKIRKTFNKNNKWMKMRIMKEHMLFLCSRSYCAHLGLKCCRCCLASFCQQKICINTIRDEHTLILKLCQMNSLCAHIFGLVGPSCWMWTDTSLAQNFQQPWHYSTWPTYHLLHRGPFRTNFRNSKVTSVFLRCHTPSICHINTSLWLISYSSFHLL